MFVIFGTKEKTKETGHGQFFCPSCKITRHYLQHESAPYFSLYFIPLFKLGSPKTYIECQSCHHLFAPDLLAVDPVKLPVSTLVLDMEKEMKAGTPSHIIYRKLLARNIPDHIAQSLSIAMLGSKPRLCKACGSLYCEQVVSCSNCGGELVDNLAPAFWDQKKAADQIYAQMVQSIR